MSPSVSVAASLPPDIRKHLAIQVLSKTEPVSRLAAREQVSRKFLYQQKHKAEQALDETSRIGKFASVVLPEFELSRFLDCCALKTSQHCGIKLLARTVVRLTTLNGLTIQCVKEFLVWLDSLFLFQRS